LACLLTACGPTPARPQRVLRYLVAMALAVAVSELHKHLGEIEAVKGVDLEVNSGEVLALLGPNGAGKTTTVEILEV